MPTEIYKYRRITTAGPNGTTLYFRNSEDSKATELCEIDGWWYVSVPDPSAMPEQWPEIEWQLATITPEIKEQIKREARACQLIADEQQRMIRAKYPVEEEHYFSRIGVGVALGAYEFQPGEQEALLAFGDFVESVRQWGRARRAELGL